MPDRLSVKIDSTRLSKSENYAGLNTAFYKMKLSYHLLKDVQELLRSQKNYEAADMVRGAMNEIKDGFEYRMGNIED